MASLKFNRNELAGAFGDLGTLVPLVTAMIILNDLNPKGIFLTFGLLYVYSGLTFRVPIPIQPMKAIAAIMITETPPLSQLVGAGFLVGVFFVLLALTNAINLINRVTPKSVIRGVQLGLGLNLILVALKFMLQEFPLGWFLSIIGVVIALIFFNSRRFPPALLLLPIGIAFSIYDGFPLGVFADDINFGFPRVLLPTAADIAQGTFALAIPQIPLTIGNAILATSLLSQDYFKEKNRVSVRHLSLSHGLMNLFSMLLGGIPVCHGAGGLAGHFRFGARTGGAMIIIGAILTLLSIFYGNAISQILALFPFSILGVLLFFSGLDLTMTIREVMSEKSELLIALLVAIVSVAIKYGYVIGLAGGIVLYHIIKKFVLKGTLRQDPSSP